MGLGNPETQKRAMKRVEEDAPYLLIGSPPCTPFSRIQFFNKSRGSPEEKARKLDQAKAHITFCIKLYRAQRKRGRFLLHEHPHGADSWSMEEVEELLAEEDVMRIRGDMCAYGLKTWAEEKGEEDQFARKGTWFMTDSPHVGHAMSRRCPNEGRWQRKDLGGDAL